MIWNWSLFSVAILSLFLGWLIAYVQFRSKQKLLGSMDATYFKGINYLLNERPDKAVDVFTNTLEVTSETIETYLGLGALFRRRGESDRAIKIHQHLLSQSKKAGFSRTQEENAKLELAYDYLAAGLLDRAEFILLELVELGGRNRKKALQKLVSIYEQLKDWPSALSYGEILLKVDGTGILTPLANYACELANAALARQDSAAALEHVKKALQFDRKCVRASIMQTQLELDANNVKNAQRAFSRILHQDPVWLRYYIDLARQVCASNKQDFASFLSQNIASDPQFDLALEIAQIQSTRLEALDYLSRYLKQHPSWVGLGGYLSYLGHDQLTLDSNSTQILIELLNTWMLNRERFVCHNCGLKTKKNHWQCPSCKQWNRVRPIDDQEASVFSA